eukprot:UN28066
MKASSRGHVSLAGLSDVYNQFLNLMHVKCMCSRYDTQGKNYLSENSVENFIYEQFDQIPDNAFRSIMKDERFHKYYVFHAVRKFMFFLDEKKRGRIPIDQLIASDIMNEFNLFREQLSNEYNWFRPETAQNIYSRFAALDRDSKGLLTKDELLGFDDSRLSNLCIERIFETKKTFDGKMDYKGFLDFILANEYKNCTTSIKYW